MKKISIKIGFYFLVCSLSIETVLFLLLYFSIVHARVNEEISSLLARGNSHRDVLEKYFDSQTISHVALMESEAETKVVITSKNGTILAKSNNVDRDMEKNLAKIPSTSKSAVIENHWRTSSYISTISPIVIQHKVKGYVYMFLGTDSIKMLINRLTYQFFIAGIITFVLTVISMFLLSKILTKPLVRMKEATKKMSKGDLSVSLNIHSKDEVGELGESIQQLASDLDYMKRERNEFLASVAHELRTPLTYVKGYADIALRKSIPSEERNKYLEIIKEEAQYVTNLVQDLFELAQMEQHNFIIEKETTNLSELLKKVVAKLETAYVDKNIQIHFTCPTTITLQLDQQRFEQVIINLLNNAYLHSKINSNIFIEVTANQDVCISIIDEGEGIPEKDLPHVFERFYRVDKSRTRATGGGGLGLAIVKEIIELHGGTITIESTLGIGTTVLMNLPNYNQI